MNLSKLKRTKQAFNADPEKATISRDAFSGLQDMQALAIFTGHFAGKPILLASGQLNLMFLSVNSFQVNCLLSCLSFRNTEDINSNNWLVLMTQKDIGNNNKSPGHLLSGLFVFFNVKIRLVYSLPDSL